MLYSVDALSSSILSKRLLYTTTSVKAVNLDLFYSAKSFEGEQRFYSHQSDTVKCKMNIGVYLPPKAIQESYKCPVLYFLNGRTATHENFFRKSGFQRFAAKFNICVISPDTSPRDVDVPAKDNLGPGASFYLNSTQEPWLKNYQMFSYVTKELVELVNNNLPVIKNKQSISGLSMGGYGALICFLKNPGFYRSISVFAPICNPMKCDLGKKALIAYIGNDNEEWKKWDPCVLVEDYSGPPIELLIDQGTSDHFLKEKHLLPENFVRASANNDCVKTIYKERNGYDHSHYFLATFIDEHFEYHAKFLNCESAC